MPTFILTALINFCIKILKKGNYFILVLFISLCGYLHYESSSLTAILTTTLRIYVLLV